MRALFIKDFNQGRSLLVFAVVGSLLIPALFHVLASPRYLYLASPRDLALIFGVILAALPIVIGFLAASGLFSTESENDTLPVLFALPLDRGQIWLAKMLAGLALTLVASALLLGLDVFLLMRHQLNDLIPLFWSYLPDMVMWAFFGFSVGMFWTALMPNLIASIAGTLLLGGGLIVGVVLLITGLGAPLLGYPPEFDMALWAFLISPSLLVASALAVTKGQLLQSRRKHLIAFPTLLVGIAVTVVATSAVTRAVTRYDRSAVAIVTAERLDSVRVAVVSAHRKPPAFARSRWERLTGVLVPHDTMPYEYLFGASYKVALDLSSGKALLVQRQPSRWGQGQWSPRWTACSPDGRFLASMSRPIGLTFGELSWRLPVLRIWDLQKGSPIYTREMKEWKDQLPGKVSLSWSPTGKYLLLWSDNATQRYVMRADGSGWRSISVGYEELPSATAMRTAARRGPSTGDRSLRRQVATDSCEWSPNEDVLLALTHRGDLYWVYPDGRPAIRIYTPEWTDGTYQSYVAGMSADRQWVALSESRSIEQGDIAVDESRLLVIRADGKERRVIWNSSDDPLATPYSMRDTAWASHDAVLYAVAYTNLHRHGPSSRTGESSARVYVWTPDQQLMQPVGDIHWDSVVRLTPVPSSDQVLVWAIEPDRSGSLGDFRPELLRLGIPTLSGTTFLLAPDGRRSEIEFQGGPEKLVKDYVVCGFDDQGRLILQPGNASSIQALDLQTGEIKKLYP